MLMLQGAMTGVFLAKDLLLFALFWDLMLIPVFLLMLGWGVPARGARAHGTAAWRYLIYNVAGGLALLLATAAFGVVNGSTDVIGNPHAARRDRRRLGPVDLRRLRVRVLDQDAGLAAAHLDARHLRRTAAAGRRGRSARCSRRPASTASSRSACRS